MRHYSIRPINTITASLIILVLAAMIIPVLVNKKTNAVIFPHENCQDGMSCLVFSKISKN